MPRQDANRIALKAVSAILDAASPLTLRIGDFEIAVTPERGAPERWPGQDIEGISEQTDGPWPAPVRLACTWDSGSCDLTMAATQWMPSSREGRQVSLVISAPEHNGDLVWITTAKHIGDAGDGEETQVWASPALFDHRKEYEGIRDVMNRELQAIARAAGLPMLSPGRVDAFRIRVPQGEVLPSPERAFATVVHLALVKLPFRDRAVPYAVRGRSYVDVDALITKARSELRGTQGSGAKRVILQPIVGGYRGYKASLDRIVQFVADSPTTPEQLERFLEDALDMSNESMRQRCRNGVEEMGLIRVTRHAVELSELGREYLNDASTDKLFDVLHQTYEAILATLVVADRREEIDATETRGLLVELCDLKELSQQQATRRCNWLTSLGMTERISGNDQITDAGRAVLARYSDEVDELSARLQALVETPAGDSVTAEADDTGDDDGDAGEPLPPEETPEPSNWSETRLDLQAQSVAPYAEKLVLPETLLERICAVLSAGKHLLLVGPPGTGKTEIAHALARAARADGYCAGLFAATASADWTTYETIGGYAIQRDNRLKFRPGAFLRAVELRQWLLIDELNRADVDKAFGELMSVLSGKHTHTPYELDDGRHVSIGSDERQYTHWVPQTFRVLATMNTWDKTSLYRLSYALQRRFAVVHVGVPAPAHYARLIKHAATVTEVDPALEEQAISRLQELFSPDGLLQHRAVGPAMALDMVRYMRRRQTGGDGLAEAVSMFLLPQLEGLDRDAARGAGQAIRAALAGWASKAALDELDERYRELFPSSDGLGE